MLGGRSLAVFVAVAFAMIACFAVFSLSDETDATDATSISLDKTEVTLSLNGSTDKTTITCTPTPAGADITGLKWESDEPDVATVTAGSKGKATVEIGKESGIAYVTATLKVGDRELTKTCKVTVEVSATSISICDSGTVVQGISVQADGTKNLTVKFEPTDATTKSVEWSSSNSSIATVDSNGKVKGVSVGQATITAKVKTVDKDVTASVTVTVTPVAVTGVSITNSPGSINVGGQTYVLKAEVTPKNATNKAVKWSSNNPSVISVDADSGALTAHTSGTAMITVTTVDQQKTSSVNITANVIPVREINIIPTEASLEVDEELRMMYTLVPEDASYKEVTWKSSNTNVVKIDANGVITGVSPGKATIVVESVAHGKTATAQIEVVSEYTIPLEVNSDGSISDIEMAYLKEALSRAADKHLSARVQVASVTNSLIFDTKLIDTLLPYNCELLLCTSNTQVLFPHSALDNIDAKGRTAGIQVETKELTEKYKYLEPGKVISISMLKNGNPVSASFGLTDVIVSYKYINSGSESASSLRVCYVPENGSPYIVSDSYYDTETKMIVFGTDHFSDYAYFFHEVSLPGPGVSMTVFGGMMAAVIVLLVLCIFLLRTHRQIPILTADLERSPREPRQPRQPREPREPRKFELRRKPKQPKQPKYHYR